MLEGARNYDDPGLTARRLAAGGTIHAGRRNMRPMRIMLWIYIVFFAVAAAALVI